MGYFLGDISQHTGKQGLAGGGQIADMTEDPLAWPTSYAWLHETFGGSPFSPGARAIPQMSV